MNSWPWQQHAQLTLKTICTADLDSPMFMISSHWPINWLSQPYEQLTLAYQLFLSALWTAYLDPISLLCPPYGQLILTYQLTLTYQRTLTVLWTADLDLSADFDSPMTSWPWPYQLTLSTLWSVDLDLLADLDLSADFVCPINSWPWPMNNWPWPISCIYFPYVQLALTYQLSWHLIIHSISIKEISISPVEG